MALISGQEPVALPAGRDLRLTLSFSRFLTTSLLVQVNSIDRNPLSVNFRVRWNYRPDSDLFIIYNLVNQFNSLAASNPVLTRERRFTIKYTYSFLRSTPINCGYDV